jgi:2-phospho-L-lactate guanylyltransferase
MRTAAILPVKRFSEAKQRLGQHVADDLRAELARSMVGDVLTALRECAAIDAVLVVTNEPSVNAAARYVGATVVWDADQAGQSAAVAGGVARALEERFDRVLCIPGDCPAVDPAEVDALLVRATGTGVVIVPDRHGSGTNGLLLAPPDAIQPSFGPDSRTRHEALARAAGLALHVERPASLLLDVDTGEDLDVLRARLAGEQGGAIRTRAVLERWGAPAGPASVSQAAAPAASPAAASPAAAPRAA